MRTAGAPDRRPLSDLTARARIRDAAIECFAEQGFDTPFRTIAEAAGVSPGLITHHFGSKAALRTACDAEVLQRYHDLKTDAMANPSASLTSWLAAPGDTGVVTVYMLRTIQAGGQPARDFLASLTEQVRSLMAEGVAAGLIRPSRDEEARLRHLTQQAMGVMLVQFLTAPDTTPDAFVASLHAREQDFVLPQLELYTEGLLTSSDMLDGYLRVLDGPTDGPTDARRTPTPAGVASPTA
ncbi:TetR family transcriptional regulator [Cellulomonas soli]|uniref:TetR/AcrR family transcriptional regulator n=1 Tax=Cellulomonas soli TaxID=931535 RepID=UPI003F82D8AC